MTSRFKGRLFLRCVSILQEPESAGKGVHAVRLDELAETFEARFVDFAGFLKLRGGSLEAGGFQPMIRGAVLLDGPGQFVSQLFSRLAFLGLG
jgi:hypothetical protein